MLALFILKIVLTLWVLLWVGILGYIIIDSPENIIWAVFAWFAFALSTHAALFIPGYAIYYIWMLI